MPEKATLAKNNMEDLNNNEILDFLVLKKNVLL